MMVGTISSVSNAWSKPSSPRPWLVKFLIQCKYFGLSHLWSMPWRWSPARRISKQRTSLMAQSFSADCYIWTLVKVSSESSHKHIMAGFFTNSFRQLTNWQGYLQIPSGESWHAWWASLEGHFVAVICAKDEAILECWHWLLWLNRGTWTSAAQWVAGWQWRLVCRAVWGWCA